MESYKAVHIFPEQCYNWDLVSWDLGNILLIDMIKDMP